MQGIVYTLFSDHIIAESGIACWNTLLAKTRPASNGIYTAGATYDDHELMALVAAYADHRNLPVDVCVRQFGEYLFPHLLKQLPSTVAQQRDLFSFLECVEFTIHNEVRRITPSATPPQIRTNRVSPTALTMWYHSSRRLCLLCEGLVTGAATHFQQKIQLAHPQCMHRGAPSCEIQIALIPE